MNEQEKQFSEKWEKLTPEGRRKVMQELRARQAALATDADRMLADVLRIGAALSDKALAELHSVAVALAEHGAPLVA